MSKAEIERFNADMKKNGELLKEVAEGVVSLDDLVAKAKARGYDFTVAEAKEFIQEAHGTLTDGDLESIAGGGSAGLTIAVSTDTGGGEVTTVALVNPFVAASDPTSGAAVVITG